MSVVISAQGLGKRYRIGAAPPGGRATRRSIGDLVAAPVRNLRRLRRLSAFSAAEEADVVWALRDVSFEVRQGEALGVIGANGAGKSTLLKILSRITKPTTGVLEIEGRVGSLLEVGTGFHPELTGRDNIYLNGSILGMDRRYIGRRLDEIIAFSGVERFIDTPVKRYSSGMYLRLAFAVAAHLEPDILIVDEVLAVGDSAFQQKCIGRMEEVAGEGRTVLFVSHNLNAVESLCSRAILIREGRIHREGDVHEVVSAYLRGVNVSEVDRHWPELDSAPGGEKVRMHRARVYPVGGEPGDTITIDSEIEIECEFYSMIPGARLTTTLHVRTLDGTIAFTTGSDSDPRWRGRALPAGLYRTRCRIPGGLLNDGGYRIELLVVEDLATVPYKQDDLLVFSVKNVVEEGVGWHGECPGVVRPALTWRTEALGPVPGGSPDRGPERSGRRPAGSPGRGAAG
jgi:lipopolysaccharide transport system ATP-binding protein